ncbi:MAG TPA: hypothetical protein VGF67_08085 [Ktedonobacteraceae bacterium]|jgi:hypothetical protein
MSESGINALLYGRLPANWTEEEAGRIKQLFLETRPEVSAILARRLWRYWQFAAPDQPLFAQDEDNVALLLHAQAYGEHIPAAGDGSRLGELLQHYRHLYEEPLFPPRLSWGPRAILSSEILAGLDSPVLHVWCASQGEGQPPQQILVIGTGLPEISQPVFSNALLTALRVHAVANDMLNIGVLLVEMPAYPETPLDIPFDVLGGGRQTLLPDAVQSAAQAMQDFANVLADLARETGLVQIHEVLVTEQTRLTDAYKASARQVSKDPERVLLLQHAGADQDLVTLIRYWQLGEECALLLFPLSADLLETRDYRLLLEAYEAATLARSKMDIRIRRDHNRQEAERLEAEKRKFDEASDEERALFWEKTVLLTEEFHQKLGITIQLPHPKEMPTELFFKKNVPHLITEHRLWEKRMEGILQSLQEAEERPDAPLRRFAASRFFDALMCGKVPNESQGTLAAFAIWQTRLRPLLWFEWRHLLRQKGIAPDALSTPHTAFHTWLTPRSQGEIAQVVLSPFTLVDQQRSVGLFDAHNRVMVVRDATDHARPFATKGQTGQQRWERLLALAKDPETTEQGFALALREELRQMPEELLPLLLVELCESRQITQAYSLLEEAAAETQQAVDTHRETARRLILEKLAHALYKTDATRRIYRALLALRVMAYQTARQALPIEKDAGQWTARICLVRALVECRIHNYPFQEFLPDAFYRRPLITPASIRAALDQAESADSGFVHFWIENLQEHPDDINKAVGLLLRGLPEGEKVCTSEEYAALMARSAIEAAHLARELEEATALLSDDHEVVVDAFARLGQALEQALLADFAVSPQGDLVDLIEVLSGVRLPRL